MSDPAFIGRLLRSDSRTCVFGCKLTEPQTPALGSLVRIPTDSPLPSQIYGMVSNIQIEDDGLIRQLITAAAQVPEEVLEDNRRNRNVPLEISVLFCGYRDDRGIHHLLPPRPPISLDRIYLCSDEDSFTFTGTGRFGYFRHILNAPDIPSGELLACHLQQTAAIHIRRQNPQWIRQATQELIAALRDDYPALINVLHALADADLPLEPTDTHPLLRGRL